MYNMCDQCLSQPAQLCLECAEKISHTKERNDSAELIKCKYCGNNVIPICVTCLSEQGLPIANSLPSGEHNTGSLQCFNEECPALWYDHQCSSTKYHCCQAKVETQQAGA